MPVYILLKVELQKSVNIDNTDICNPDLLKKCAKKCLNLNFFAKLNVCIHTFDCSFKLQWPLEVVKIRVIIFFFMMIMEQITTRIAEMLGFLFFRLKDFQIILANILFTIEHGEHNKCLN